MNNSEGAVWSRKTRKTREMDLTNTAAINGKQLKKKKKQCPLLSFHELPDYMKDNEFILNYYRADWPLKEAFFSVFRWHNETLNVWTHLLAFALFLGLTVANFVHASQLADLFGIFTSSFPTSSEPNASHNPERFFSGQTKLIDLKHPSPPPETNLPPVATQWPFFIFLGGAMFCLLSSTTCHLFSCHSHSLNLRLLRLDYAGITAMIISSFFPPIYYIFQCQPLWQILYLSAISVMGLFTIFTLLSPALSTAKFRTFRALLFVAMGLFGLIPAVHALVVNWGDPKRNITLAYESAMAVFYLTGTGFYVSRVPERWRPGWFDLAGQSHQIFHVFVVLGALAHYGAALVFLEYRGRIGCDGMKG
ncbi:heptahelical transmembrane protein 1 [Diospyros lotus]|uniref:heptahelical transmembrane protein 1 n=1 Tax=Diospyros lotus TaxID=55363 RepID=UPI00224C99FA|nr:heptahelical transmembrane protein 1 [Diospyros lotus]